MMSLELKLFIESVFLKSMSVVVVVCLSRKMVDSPFSFVCVFSFSVRCCLVGWRVF